MDEYSKEIGDLEAQIEAMVQAEDDARTIVELEMQLEVLRTLYSQAKELYQRGRQEPELRSALALRGYGDWSLDNVYAFVYEVSVDFPGGGHRDFVNGIAGADFESLLEGRTAS